MVKVNLQRDTGRENTRFGSMGSGRKTTGGLPLQCVPEMPISASGTGRLRCSLSVCVPGLRSPSSAQVPRLSIWRWPQPLPSFSHNMLMSVQVVNAVHYLGDSCLSPLGFGSQGRDLKLCLWDLAEGRNTVVDSVHLESVGFCRGSILAGGQQHWTLAVPGRGSDEVSASLHSAVFMCHWALGVPYMGTLVLSTWLQECCACRRAPWSCGAGLRLSAGPWDGPWPGHL